MTHTIPSDAKAYGLFVAKLKLNGNYLGGTGAMPVVDLILRPSSCLVELHLVITRMGGADARALAIGLQDTVQLERLIILRTLTMTMGEEKFLLKEFIKAVTTTLLEC